MFGGADHLHAHAFRCRRPDWTPVEPPDRAAARRIPVKSPENRAFLYRPTTVANGTVVPAMAGWQFPRHPGFMEIKGSSPGFSAYLSRFTAPGDLVCVTLLANKEGLDLTGLARDHGLKDKAVVSAMERLLGRLVARSTDVY